MDQTNTFLGSYVEVLDGACILQEFGNTQNRTFDNAQNCPELCANEESFACAGFLWHSPVGVCILMDKVDLTKEIFKDRSSSSLYVRKCDNERNHEASNKLFAFIDLPQIKFCEFAISATHIDVVDALDKVDIGDFSYCGRIMGFRSKIRGRLFSVLHIGRWNLQRLYRKRN